MISDPELMRQYASEGNQAAFTEVVHRYTDLVYSAALRMVNGDAYLAQDVAQRVFSALANQAGTLSRRAGIVGWLYTTTRYSASLAVRAEQRRRARELAAFTMQDEPTAQMDWLELQPLLDEELCRLGSADREAVLLRFFQNKSHREVGAALGVSEDLARKRIERALEKLRQSFSRRGLGVSAVVLAESISANSVQAAPIGLAASLASSSLANGGQAGWIIANAGLFFYLMKTKIIAITSVLVLSLFIVGAWQWNQSSASDVKQSGREGGVSAANTAQGGKVAVSPNTAVAAPVMGAVHASGVSIDAKVPVMAPATDLNLAINDILQLAAAKNYAVLVQNYLPQKRPPADMTQEQALQAKIDDPATPQMLDTFTNLLMAAKDAVPEMSADGRSARLRATPDSDTALVLVQLNGTWHISGIEKETPGEPAQTAPQPPMVKRNPGPGGYVP